MYTSNLLKMQVWGYKPSANNRFIDYKDSSRAFEPMCGVFVKEKKGSELSHLYFKFLVNMLLQATKVLVIWEKTDVFASIRMQSLEKQKRRGELMKIHHFII